MKNVRFAGLDVHAETIAVAIAEPDGEVRSLGTIPNWPEPIGRLIRKLGKAEQLRVCYEAGPTGYVLYWQLSELGVKCEVIAPTLVPVQGWRQGQDGPARCGEARPLLSGGGSDAGAGT
jgi:transposase